MGEDKEEILNKTSSDGIENSIVFEFGYLVNIILDYYETNSKEDGEDWKKGTKYDNNMIPEVIDNLVQKAFESQLKKFID